jgi:predicted acyltransferase
MRGSVAEEISGAPATVDAPAVTAPGRLMSLDLFRGATIALMILVNNPGSEPVTYWPLQHAHWNGWTPTDLVFPFFLFIVGVAMAFSFTSRLNRGDSRGSLLKHVLWRGLILAAMGIFLNGFPNHYGLDHWRFYGVLQRIAICYVITAVLELWTDWRTQLAVAVACLVGYSLLMRFVPVPGFGIPTHDMPILDPDRNIAAWLDRKLLMGHLYEVTRDPEGVISTIPAVATCLAGLLTGKWLRTQNSPSKKALIMAAVGMVAIAAGKLWNLSFPINKKLWTSSYVLFTAGLALIFLALCYWVVDGKRLRGWWTKLVLIFGMNAIAAYFFAEVVAKLLELHLASLGGQTIQAWLYERLFVPLASPPNASLIYAIVFVVFCWCAMAVLYRNRLFLKI